MCTINISTMNNTEKKTKTYARLKKVNPQISVNNEGRFVCDGHTCYIWKNDRLRCKGCFISAMLERTNNRDLLVGNSE